MHTPQASCISIFGSKKGYTHAQATTVTECGKIKLLLHVILRSVVAYLGTSEKNSPIIVLPEEIQPVMNRTGQLGDAGSMNGDGGFTLDDMLLNPQKQV